MNVLHFRDRVITPLGHGRVVLIGNRGGVWVRLAAGPRIRFHQSLISKEEQCVPRCA